MKFRILAKKYYSKTTAKTRLETRFDYDTSGELAAEMLLLQQPCFEHVTVKDEIVFQRKIIIYTGTQEYYWTDFEKFLEYGFLVYFINNQKLVPLINTESSFLKKSEKISTEDLQILLKNHKFKADEVIILDHLGGSDDLYKDDFLDDYIIHHDAFFANRKDCVYVYVTETNKVGYSMLSPFGAQIKQITDLNADNYPGLWHSDLSNDLYAIMLKNGHIEDFVDIDQSHQALILTLNNCCESGHSIQTRLNLFPELEVLQLKYFSINGEVPGLALPKLQSLSIIDSYTPNSSELKWGAKREFSLSNLQKIISAAPNLHTLVLENVIEPHLFAEESLQLGGSNLKLLTISVGMLPFVRMSQNNALVALEITPYNGSEDHLSEYRRIDPDDLERIVRQCPALEFLGISKVNFRALPRNLPPHILIEYSKDTLDQFQLNELVTCDTQSDILTSITHRDIIHKLEKYLRLQGVDASEMEPYLAQFESHSEEALAHCFCSLKQDRTAEAMHLAWKSFINSIGAWDATELPEPGSLAMRSLQRLWLAMHTFLFPADTCSNGFKSHFGYSKAVFSLESVWKKPPYQELLFCNQSTTVLLYYSAGFWFFFDPAGSVANFSIIAQGDENRIQRFLKQRFTDSALYVRTQRVVSIDFNPSPSSKKVADYIKAGGLLTLVCSHDSEPLNHLNIDTLSSEDLASLFVCNQSRIPAYQEAHPYNPKLIRRMLERYQILHPAFAIPELGAKSSQQLETVEDAPKRHSTLLTLKPEHSQELFENQKRAPATRRKAFQSSPSSLSEEWRDPELWFQRPSTHDFSQRLILDKLQDYLVLQYGMDDVTWLVLNTLETGIEQAIALCFADYWQDTTITDPQQLIFGWKDAIAVLRYWKDSQQCPTPGSPLNRLLHTLWFYTYSTHFAQHAHDPYRNQQNMSGSDLGVLLAQYSEQPLILANYKEAVTILYREGIWYLFDVQDVTGEPQYFRRGDESVLQQAILDMLPGALTVITRQPLRETVGVDVMLLPKNAAILANQSHLSAILSSPALPDSIACVASKLRANTQEIDGDHQFLFPMTSLLDAEMTISAQDPHLALLSQCSIESASDLPKKTKQMVPATIQLDSDLKLAEFDDDILTREGENILLQFSTQNHLDLYLDHILATPEAKARGVWLVNNMRDLQCAVASLRIHANNRCEEVRGPAGDFYNVLQSHPHLIIAVNWGGFTFKEMVQANPLLDAISQRSNDNIPISNKALVLSLQNKGDPSAYKGNDFISRHDEKPIELPSCLQIPPLLDFGGDLVAAEFDNIVEIDFYHSVHWKKYLYGRFNPSVGGICFEPSDLLNQPFVGSLKIILRNAPLQLPGFRQAIYTLLQSHHIRYYGREMSLPTTLHIDYVEGYTFALEPLVPQFTQQCSMDYDRILNPTTANDFFVQYQFTEQGIIGLPGVLEAFAGRELKVYVTRDLGPEIWSRLFKQAQQSGCRLICMLDKTVHLPPELVEQKLFSLSPTQDSKQLELNYVMSTAGYDRLISVDGLSAQDLFYRRFRDEQGMLREEICDIWKFLLESSGRVLLVGDCSLKLKDLLWDVVNGRGYLHNGQFEQPIGTLHFLSPKVDKALLAGRSVRQHPIPNSLPIERFDTSEDFSLSRVTEFNDTRYQDMTDALRTSRLVCLLGETGVGKSHFMQAFSGVIFDDIEKWIQQGGILFLDEANLKQFKWEQFESVMWDPPSFLYKGKYYRLTKKHQIVVAMNPSNYSKERQTPELFHTYANVVVFSSFPNASLYHEMLLPILGDCDGHEAMLGRLFLNVYQRVKTLDDKAFSVRELQMMAYLYKVTKHLYPDDDQACALYQAYHLASQALPESKKGLFHKAFIQKWHHVPEPYRAYPERLQGEPDSFEIIPCHHPAYAALDDFMSVRDYKRGEKGGLSGFLLEGEPGTGKSLFLRLYLLDRGMKEGADFYYIPAKWLPNRKQEYLLRAFHDGKIVIMDEFNVSDMIEEVLNAVLSGVDLEGNAAKVGGFVLLATQNPADMGGRNIASVALQRRMIYVQFPAYTLAQMFQILIKHRFSIAAVYPAVMRSLREPSLGFRDIYKDAKNRHQTGYSNMRVSIVLPEVFWRLRETLQPFTVSDGLLLQSLHKKGWDTLVYQGKDSEYYFHDSVYRQLKQQYSNLQSLHIRLQENATELLRTAFNYIQTPKTMITETVFAHLELDMEMPGLAGLQGEHVEHILGCFRQYMTERGLQDPRVVTFIRAVDALLMQCRSMKNLNAKSTRSHQGLQTYCKETAQQLQMALVGQEYFFSGGWINQPPGSSHSMIYRFEKTARGLLFYIYNAGAGLAEHEKVSTEHSERYYPVKIYAIPEPLDEKELSYLLQRLLLPNLLDHPARSHEDDIIDATKLYRNIEKSLEYMNAEQILAKKLLQSEVATQGVMAGACTLSVQQLLNCFLNDPVFYRCLMLDLKLYVLKEFISSYPAPRHAHINQLIVLAIENNLKILQSIQDRHSADLQPFMDPLSAARDLRTYKKNIIQELWLVSSKEQASVWVGSQYSIDWVPDVATRQPLVPIQADPLGKLMKIEREILALEVSSKVGISLSPMSLFGAVDSFGKLEILQSQYQKYYKRCYGDSQLPRLFLVQFSLLHACAQIRPDFSECFQKELGAFVKGYEHSVHLATCDLTLDKKLLRIMRQYSYRAVDYDSYFLNKYSQILVRSDVSCKAALEKHYSDKYASNNQPIHVAVRRQYLQALYVLLEDLDEGGNLKKYTKLDAVLLKPLIDSIQTQMRVENFIVRSFCLLLNQTLPGLVKPRLQHHKSRLIMVTQLTQACPSQQEFCVNKTALSQHKYPMQDSPEKDALLADAPQGTIWASQNRRKPTENDIQLASNQTMRRMTKLDLFIRELAHLRLIPEHQIVLTLDYFLGETSHLSSTTTQSYIEANIFQPGLLIPYQNDPQLVKKWDEFIQLGLNECRDLYGKISHASLFFLRLQFYFDRYFGYKGRLRQNLFYLNDLIDKQTNREILSTLHQYKFLTIMSVNDPKLFVSAYESYVYIQAIGNQQIERDTASEDELRRAQYAYKEWLIAAKAVSEQMFSMVSEKYPWLLDASDSTDFFSGKLYYKDFALSPIPLYWKNLTILRRLGLSNDTLCAISRDEKVLEFGAPNPFLRALKVNERWVFQKKWRNAHSENWYELGPLSVQQAHRYGLDNEDLGYPCIKHHLPAWLTDDQTEAWVNTEDKNRLIFVQNNRICYEWQQGQGLRFIKSAQQTAALVDLPSEHRDALLQYEDAQFIVHYAYAGENVIHFPRYGMDLIYDAQNKTIIHPDSQTVLSTKLASPFASNVACLTFEKSHIPVECIVPVQPFYVLTHEVQTLGEYYPLVHDRTLHIPAAHMTHLWGEQRIAKKDQPMWRFANSEQYVRFRMVDGKPQADTAEDALYLCYLYLATHDLQQAWRVLTEVNRKGGISGSFNELKYLEWITNKLPAIDVPTDYTEERIIHEALRAPRYIACKLKALALLSRCILQGNIPNISDKFDGDLSSANGEYAAFQTKSIRKFYTHLPHIIAMLHTQFLKVQRYLPSVFELDNHECDSLLTYIDAEGSPARGPLGVARLQLNLKLLLKLEHNLLALRQSMGDKWTHSEESRLHSIQQELQTQVTVSKQSTRLDYVPVDLSLPTDFNDKTLQANPQCAYLKQKDLLSLPSYSDEEAIGALSSMTTGEEASPTVIDYRTRLRNFCQASLRIARHVPLSEVDTPIPYVANVLYRILNNPHCLRLNKYCGWDAMVTLVQGLSVPPVRVLQARDVYEGVLAKATDLLAELRAKMFRKQPIQTSAMSVEDWKIECCWSAEYRKAGEYSKVGSEQSVGKAIYLQMQKKKRIAQQYLQNAEERADLRRQAAQHQGDLDILLNQKWDEIEIFARKAPEDGVQKEAYLNAVAAASRNVVSKQDLLKLYLHQDRAEYYATTTLSNGEDVDRLHSMLHEYISLSVQNQKMTRVLQALDGEDYFDMAETLMQESSDTAQTDPSLMLFQYLENKLIRPRQIEALHRLLEVTPNGGFREMVEKILMGGGKSKLVLPILAQKKANGTNLVVVEAQRALLKTQHADMNQLSQGLFNQTGHIFEFNRDSDCSAARLKQIYKFFTHISINKDYLFTTGESMQSLHLKYRELLRSRPLQEKDWPEWRQQVIWAEKIVKLLKLSGDAILDEVQEGLRQNKKINYTFGPAIPVDANTISYSIQLFELLERYPDCSYDGNCLIDCLFQERLGPFKHLNTPNLQRVAKDYLSNRFLNIPPEIQELDRDTRNALAFYKEQILLLPKTTALKYKEKYGPSKQYKKNAAEQAIAIPYRANNTPNERSRFGHVLKTINCTIQGMLQQGVDERLLCQSMQQWQAQARQMMKDNPEHNLQMNDTPLAQEVNALLAGSELTLQTIDIHRAEDRAVLNKMKHSSPLIYRILQDFVLPCIPQEQSVLHGDSYDHVDLYRSVQGLSGTPGNHRTFKRVCYDESTALGNDGYLQEVLKEKVTGLRAPPFHGLSQFIEALAPSEPTHALIDICARFAGFDAIEVAAALAQYFAKQGSPIKYVLYFNEDDILCALPVAPQGKPVVLGTTDRDEICRKLGGCSLEHCFTYYDQERTLGLDLTHIPTANAQVLVDNNTHLHRVLQGCTRMRGLEKQQTLELIVPPDLDGISVSDLIQMAEDKEKQDALEDNAAASFDKLENIIRLDLEQRILAIDPENIDLKHRYMLAFERFFFDQTEHRDHYAKYGAMYHKDFTQTILRSHQCNLLREWRECLALAGVSHHATDERSLTAQMDCIIIAARDICPEKILNRIGDKQFDEEVETEKELELDLEKLDEYYDINLSSVAPMPWSPRDALPLNTWMGVRPNFSKNLLYSPNFKQVYQGKQSLLMDGYAKPVHLIYFVKHQERLTACLVTQAEAQEIRLQNPSGQWWLTTTRHSPLGGYRPESIEDDLNYQRLIEQIRYFKGELNTMVDSRKPCVWLNKDAEEKLDFYTQHILPNREATYVRDDVLPILKQQPLIQEPGTMLEQVTGFFSSFFGV